MQERRGCKQESDLKGNGIIRARDDTKVCKQKKGLKRPSKEEGALVNTNIREFCAGLEDSFTISWLYHPAGDTEYRKGSNTKYPCSP